MAGHFSVPSQDDGPGVYRARGSRYLRFYSPCMNAGNNAATGRTLREPRLFKRRIYRTSAHITVQIWPVWPYRESFPRLVHVRVNV